MVLRRPVDEDAPDALLLCTDPEVARWNPVSTVVDLESADGHHAALLEELAQLGRAVGDVAVGWEVARFGQDHVALA